jgi:DNA end-binding protein Ku
LYYAPEVRNFSEIQVIPVKVSDAEKDMAVRLLENFSNDNFDPSRYEDTYGKTVQEAVEAKIAGQEVIVPKDVSHATVLDIFDALKMSVASSEPAKKAKKAKVKVK